MYGAHSAEGRCFGQRDIRNLFQRLKRKGSEVEVNKELYLELLEKEVVRLRHELQVANVKLRVLSDKTQPDEPQKARRRKGGVSSMIPTDVEAPAAQDEQVAGGEDEQFA